MSSSVAGIDWGESPSAHEPLLQHTGTVFESLFERSADAIWLLDPQSGVFVDCNQAAIELIGAENKQQLLNTRPEDLSPPFQPDGARSADKSAEIIAIVERQKTLRFEWVVRRLDGREVPIEVSATEVLMGGKRINIVFSRDISERKKAERELLELTEALERRVEERTDELATSEAQLRALVEHAPEAIVVFNGDNGQFLYGNQHACALYGVPMERLATLTPADVSPEFQPGGRRSSELARELMNEALSGGMPVFEWLHRQQPNGRLIATEVRLLRLPAEGQNLIRASIIDNTERKRAEQVLRESEEKFRALFEGSSHGVVLHDENQILEVNPAAVRIMGCQSPQELLGKHPSETSPLFQPNGESSAELGRQYIQECMDNGSARFEWMSRNPQGKEVPLEVALTRIQWSGRQVIQALITDIAERTMAEHALREANRELRREIEQRTRAEESLKERVRTSTLSAEVALALNAGTDVQAMLQQCVELAVRHLDVAFARIWTLNEPAQTLELQASAGYYTRLDGSHSRVKVSQLKIGFIARERKPHLTNSVQTDDWVSDKEWARREGMVAFAGYPLLLEDRVLGVLALFARRPLVDDVLKALGAVADSIALGIERKRAQAALAESEALFSAAFEGSPILIVIGRMSDQKYVLANDAFVNWSGFAREEILGRDSTEFGIWESQDERDAVWADLRRAGSVQERECRLRNRKGDRSTMLISFEVIQINHAPHCLAMGLDITARKQAEAESLANGARLRESEARFSAAFHASPAFLGILRSSDGAYVLANDAFVNWLGYPREEVIGRSSAEFGMWENVDERASALNDMRTIGSIRQREVRWRNRQGECLTILLSAETIQLNDTPHILSFAQDITQRKRAEEELRASEARVRESEARFSAAFRASPVSITISRMDDGRYTLANEAFLKWTGYRLDEVLGRDSRELSLWADPADREPFWEELRRVRFIHERECRVRNRQGEIFTMLLSADIIEVDRVPHLLTVGIDITQRKRAEVEMLKALAREKELGQLKSNFVSMVSHEFRTPLGIIQSSAELLREFHQKMQPGEREEQLESIAGNTRRMAGMMEGVLVLSRLDAGKLDFHPAALNLNLFCRRVVDEVLSATNRRCIIELTVNSVPSEAQADEQLLGHILTNLLSNAVKYSEPGATVRFTVERDGQDAVCVIRDQGIGISVEDQQQLFKAFNRGSNVGTRPGTGLGLLLVKRCAKLHGGRVKVESKVGEGTTVMVRLPVFPKEI
jgi:PAS domain S-box-containing protein